MEIFDIGVSDLEPMSMNLNDGFSMSSQPSVNFGTGIELLMNDKKKSSSNNVNIDLGELDNLENELNELSGRSSNNSTTKTLSGFTSNLFGFDEPTSMSSNENDSKLGNATKETLGNNKTWDGFTKMNDVPLRNTGSNNNNNFAQPTTLNDREKRRKKAAMIKKLEDWYEKGFIKNISHFNKDSVFEEVEDEYETALEDKRKKDSIKLHGWWFMTFVNSMEYANAAFNPFDINLDGWGEQISEDLDSYEDIFGELHEKYKGGKLAPEISLLLRLGFSACIVNFTNKALSTATPGFNDVIRQSPELMKMFTNATVNSMNSQSPGFAFASNLMNNTDQTNNAFGPPPAPIETKNQPAPQRPNNSMNFKGSDYGGEAPSNRPDLSSARNNGHNSSSPMFREQGVNINNNYESVNSRPQPPHQQQQQPHSQQERSMRPQTQQPNNIQLRQEMKGPQTSDIDHILSGLKTRAVPANNPFVNIVNMQDNTNIMDDSMISISSLKDLQNVSIPKKTGRKNRSDKNTIALDI